MQTLRNFCLLLSWLVLAALLNYELAAKAPHTAIGPLPGSYAAVFVDRMVRYQSRTGVTPIDRLLHEGQEAYLYYRILLAGQAH